jgi:membrane-associated phospholipid phosphatase
MRRLVGGCCALFAIVALIGFPLAGLSLDVRGALPSVFAVVALLGLYLRYRKRALPRLRETAELTFWGVLLSTLYILPMYVVARRPVPFSDALLRTTDAWFHVPRTSALDVAYDSLQFGCLLALMLPPLVGKAERTRTLLVALVFSSIATLVTFALFRAIGPWEGTLTATPIQRGCSMACRALEDSAPYVVDLRRPDPLIAFPSWHAILAVLSSITLFRVRWLAVPSIVWGALVVASTVTTGWHYTIDTLAGVAVAALAWALASREPFRALTVEPGHGRQADGRPEVQDPS